MSRNVTEALKGSNEIVQNITGVAQAAQSTASGATHTQTAAQELARLAAELQTAVSQFKYDDEAQAARPHSVEACNRRRIGRNRSTTRETDRCAHCDGAASVRRWSQVSFCEAKGRIKK